MRYLKKMSCIFFIRFDVISFLSEKISNKIFHKTRNSSKHFRRAKPYLSQAILDERKAHLKTFRQMWRYAKAIAHLICITWARREKCWHKHPYKSYNVDTKIMKPTRKLREPSPRKMNLNQFNEFRWTSLKVLPIEKTYAGYILVISQGFNRSNRSRTNSPRYPFLQLIQHIQVATESISPGMKSAFRARLGGRSIEIKGNFSRKKLHTMNQGSNILKGSFINTNKQYLQYMNVHQRLIHPFHINSTTTIQCCK